jgi:hypothetical protein
MKNRATRTLGFTPAILVPIALYLGCGAALISCTYWLMQPTVIENTGMGPSRPTHQAAYHYSSEPASTEPEIPLSKIDPPAVSIAVVPAKTARIEKVRPNSPKTKSVKAAKVSPPNRLVVQRQDPPFWGNAPARGWF